MSIKVLGYHAFRDFEAGVPPDTNPPNKGEIRDFVKETHDRVTALEGSQAGGLISTRTWTELHAIIGTVVGETAEVPVTDVGTHTDPVVGGSVDNAGRYSWRTSPATGWRRDTDEGMTILQSQIDDLSDAVDLEASARAAAIVNEASARTAAIAAEATARAAGIATEATARTAAIATEATARAAADTTEASTRAAADTTEAAARAAADTTEASARATTDTALKNQASYVLSITNSDPVAMVASAPAGVTALLPGMRVVFVPTVDNAAGATLAIPGFDPPLSLRSPSGSPLPGKTLKAAHVYSFVWTGSVLIQDSGDVQDLFNKASYLVEIDGGTGSVYSGTIEPRFSALVDGQKLTLAPDRNSLDGQRLHLNGLIDEGLYRPDETPVKKDDLVLGRVYPLVFRGGRLLLLEGWAEGARVAANKALARQDFRPGESPQNFTAALTGAFEDCAPLSATINVQQDGKGLVVTFDGAAQCATRAPFRIDAADVWQVVFQVQRRSPDPDDPEGDAVRCAIRWLDRNFADIGVSPDLELELIRDLITTSGVARRSFILSKTPGGDVDFVIPAGAVWARPYAQTFGASTTHTDILDVRYRDVTGATVFAPDVSGLAATLAGLVSQDLAPRLALVETALSGAETLTFQSFGAAETAGAAGTIPTGTTLLMFLGDDYVGLMTRAIGVPDIGFPDAGAGGGYWEVNRSSAPMVEVDEDALALPIAYIPERAIRRVVPEKFGCFGDGVTDDTDAWALTRARALARGLRIDGGGLTYGLDAQLTLNDGEWWEDVSILDINPGDAVRTLVDGGVANRIRMAGCKIDRGGNLTGGDPATNVAFRLDGGIGHDLDLEVTGDGAGVGAWLGAIQGRVRLNVHDMAYIDDTATDDQITGVLLDGTKQIAIDARVVEINGSGLFFGGDVIPGGYITRGIALASTEDVTIRGHLRGAAQCVDITGGPVPNVRWRILDTLLEEALSYGVACKNTAFYGLIDNCIFRYCGQYAIIFQGPVTDIVHPIPAGNETRRVNVSNTSIFETGSKADGSPSIWAAGLVVPDAIIAGIAALHSDERLSFPKGIAARDCRIISATGNMKYGLFSDVTPLTPDAEPNVYRNVSVEGATEAPVSGWTDRVAVFRVNKGSVDQDAVAAGSAQLVTFPNVALNLGSFYSAGDSQWQPPGGRRIKRRTGVYFTEGVAAGNQFTLQFFKNGGLFQVGDAKQAGGPGPIGVYGAMEDFTAFDGSDYYEVKVVVTGANKTISGVAEATYDEGEVID